MDPSQKPASVSGYSDDDQPISCSLCDKQFFSLLNFKIHARGHLLEEYNTCESCQRQYSSKFELRDHNCSTGEVPFSCDVCSVLFYSKHSFIEHLRSHYVSKTYKCPLCGVELPPSGPHVCEPKKTGSPDNGSFVCEVCKKLFFSKLNFSIHQRVHADAEICNSTSCEVELPYLTPSGSFLSKPKKAGSSKKETFVCAACKKQFFSKLNFAIHQRVHAATSCYTCKDCGVNLPESSMGEHICFPMHHTCKICLKDCLSKHELMYHKLSHIKTRGSYSCRVCQKYFFRKVNLIVHSLKHKKETYCCEKCKKSFFYKKFVDYHLCSPIRCFDCKEIFQSEMLLQAHFKAEATKCSLKCKECLKSFRHQGSLIRHIVWHNQQNKCKLHSCPVCGKKCSTKKELKTHFTAHRESLMFCKFCADAFIDIKGLNQHLKNVHTGVQKYCCNICQLKFTTKKEWKLHETVHTGKPLYVCEFCNQQFVLKRVWSDHVWRHRNKQNLFKCKLCYKVFKTETSLNFHSKNGLHACSFCSKMFCTKQKLEYHVKMKHAVELPQACSFCSKTFSCQMRLIEHLRVHGDIRPFECLICDKKFRKESHLKYHSFTHVEDEGRPYKCDICGKGYSMATYLRYHYRIKHTKDRPVLCEICGKSFATKPKLTHHKTYAHAEKKQFKCNECGKGFIFQSGLQRHQYTHSSEKPFCCSVCNKGFIFNSLLKKHVEKHKAKS